MPIWIIIRRLKCHTPMDPVDKIVCYTLSKDKAIALQKSYERRGKNYGYYYWYAEVKKRK